MKVLVNQQWRLAARPIGLFKESDFEWREEPVPAPGPSQVLVRNLYLSLDLTNRGWAQEKETYLPPVGIGEVMRGITIGVVEGIKNAPRAVNKLFDGSHKGKLIVKI